MHEDKIQVWNFNVTLAENIKIRETRAVSMLWVILDTENNKFLSKQLQL